jgi:UDP-glucuronate decarboxylase
MNKKDFHGPVNLGNPVEMTIVELAKAVIDLTGAKSKLIKKPLPKDDPTRRRPDISLAAKELGWKPTVELTAGLTSTIKDFEKRMSAGEG